MNVGPVSVEEDGEHGLANIAPRVPEQIQFEELADPGDKGEGNKAHKDYQGHGHKIARNEKASAASKPCWLGLVLSCPVDVRTLSHKLEPPEKAPQAEEHKGDAVSRAEVGDKAGDHEKGEQKEDPPHPGSLCLVIELEAWVFGS